MTLEELESRLKSLEDQIKKKDESFNLGNRQSSAVGSSSSELILKNNGKIKLQWGNTFIDLIKDGKVNTEANFIYRRETVGTLDGIYVNGDKATLVSAGTLIPLNNVGTTYVSFVEEQEPTRDLLETALRNIGFSYKSISDVESVLDGLIYIEDEHQLYIVINGLLTTINASIPNPYTKLLVIAKSDDSQGSLVIRGSKKENGIYLDTLQLYSEDDSILNSTSNIRFDINDSPALEITNTTIKSYKNILTDNISSENSKFRLFYDGSLSWLYVDNIVNASIQNDDSSDKEAKLYIVRLTEEDFYALETKDLTTLYFVTDSDDLLQLVWAGIDMIWERTTQEDPDNPDDPIIPDVPSNSSDFPYTFDIIFL